MSTAVKLEESLLKNVKTNLTDILDASILANANHIASLSQTSAIAFSASSEAEKWIQSSAHLDRHWDIVDSICEREGNRWWLTDDNLAEMISQHQEATKNHATILQEASIPKVHLQQILDSFIDAPTIGQTISALGTGITPQLDTAITAKAILTSIEPPLRFSDFIGVDHVANALRADFNKAALFGMNHTLENARSALLAGVEQSLATVHSAAWSITDNYLEQMHSALMAGFTHRAENIREQFADIMANIAMPASYAAASFEMSENLFPYSTTDRWIEYGQPEVRTTRSGVYVEIEPAKVKPASTGDTDLLSVLEQALLTGRLTEKEVLDLLQKRSSNKRGPQEPPKEMIVALCTKYEHLKYTRGMTQEVFVSCHNDVCPCSLSSFKRYYTKFKLWRETGLI